MTKLAFADSGEREHRLAAPSVEEIFLVLTVIAGLDVSVSYCLFWCYLKAYSF